MTKAIGSLAEDKVCQWLRQQGNRIIERNFHAGRTGEIDIIAQDGKYLCFIEVKYRRVKKAGTGAEAVTLSKQIKICKSAVYYMKLKGFSYDIPVRFDVADVSGEDMQIHYIKNAFDYCL